MLARVQEAAVDTVGPEHPVLVEWWRQPHGDPNKNFVRAIKRGKGRQPWTQHISRGTIIIADIPLPQNNKPKKLSATVKKNIATLRHPSLSDWEYQKGKGLVRK